MILLSTRNAMELTYLVRGADGKEYGPVNLEQLGSWVRERRLIEQQEIKRSDMQHWAVAGTFSELRPLFANNESVPTSAPNTPSASPQPVNDARTISQLKSAGSWFYWIAGLSLVNSISAFSGSDWRFIIGLGITQIFDEIGSQLGGRAISLILSLIAAGVFVLFGVFANKGHLWAFIVGMILFALDGVIFLLGPDWLGVGFHVLVLFFLFRGLKACRDLSRTTP
jgi:hypothetical protein